MSPRTTSGHHTLLPAAFDSRPGIVGLGPALPAHQLALGILATTGTRVQPGAEPARLRQVTR